MGSRKTLTRFVGWMIVVGAITGPGYALYCEYWSGSQVGKFRMSQAKSYTVELNPEMNPVGFIWSGNVGRRRTVSYSARLFLQEQRVMDTSVAVSGGRDGGTEHALIAAISVPNAGQYRLMLDGSGASGVEVEVRRNVMVRRTWIFALGLTVLIASVLLYFWLKNRDRKELYELAEEDRGSRDHESMDPDFTVAPGVCPYCRKPLKSPRAKQCLLCGADWHENVTRKL